MAQWSVVAEWLGCRTLNQRVMGSNLGEGTAWYLWAGYLKSTARVSHKQNFLRHPYLSKKIINRSWKFHGLRYVYWYCNHVITRYWDVPSTVYCTSFMANLRVWWLTLWVGFWKGQPKYIKGMVSVRVSHVTLWPEVSFRIWPKIFLRQKSGKKSY
jgi:hypothetical protein